MSGIKLAVIPARGGSKRIPGKNIREFCGKPVIAYSIAAAQQCGLFDQIVVSTDCETTATLAQKLGAEVPFIRPPQLSDDHTPTIPVIRHAIEQVNDSAAPVSFACCIYATAPFVDPSDLQRGYEQLASDPAARFAFAVTTYSFPIFRALRLNSGRVEMFFPEHQLTRSQDLPEAWHDAGQFYWGTAAAWSDSDGIFSDVTIGVPLPRHRVQDIDTEEDWVRAEHLYQIQRTYGD